MKRETPIFRGTGTAIITPFKDGRVDYSSFEKILEAQVAGGVNAIIVCGTTGEAATLSDEEHRDVVDFTVKQINHRIPVIAGTGSNDTAYAIDLSQHACEVGADALLLVTPYYNKSSQRGLVKHFEAIANATNKPNILYNVPSRTGVNISIEAYKELGQHHNIVATKEASGNISFIAQLVEKCGDLFDIYSGNDDQITPMMSLGAVGVISVLSNVMPKETSQMTRLFLDGNIKESTKLQTELLSLINSLFMVVNPIPIKTAMAKMGLCDIEMRLPLCEMSDEENERLYSVMRRYNLIK